MATEIYDGVSHNAIIGGGKELWSKLSLAIMVKLTSMLVQEIRM